MVNKPWMTCCFGGSKPPPIGRIGRTKIIPNTDRFTKRNPLAAEKPKKKRFHRDDLPVFKKISWIWECPKRQKCCSKLGTLPRKGTKTRLLGVTRVSRRWCIPKSPVCVKSQSHKGPAEDQTQPYTRHWLMEIVEMPVNSPQSRSSYPDTNHHICRMYPKMRMTTWQWKKIFRVSQMLHQHVLLDKTINLLSCLNDLPMSWCLGRPVDPIIVTIPSDSPWD